MVNSTVFGLRLGLRGWPCERHMILRAIVVKRTHADTACFQCSVNSHASGPRRSLHRRWLETTGSEARRPRRVFRSGGAKTSDSPSPMARRAGQRDMAGRRSNSASAISSKRWERCWSCAGESARTIEDGQLLQVGFLEGDPAAPGTRSQGRSGQQAQAGVEPEGEGFFD